MYFEIETKRMLGYRMVDTHFDDLNRLHKDQEVAKTMNGVWSDDFVRERLKVYIDHWDQHGYGLWMFYHKESGEFIGRGGLVKKEIDGVDEVEVGFAILSSFWRQGYAEEMGRRSIEIGFNDLNLSTLVSHTLFENMSSQNLIQKLGFIYEKEITFFNLPQKLYRLKSPQMV